MKYGMLLGYMSQFSNVARAEELRRMAGTHDVMVAGGTKATGWAGLAACSAAN